MRLRQAKKIRKMPWPIRLMAYNRDQLRRADFRLLRYAVRDEKAFGRAMQKVREAVAKARSESTQ
jgi:hypothetical protein